MDKVQELKNKIEDLKSQLVIEEAIKAQRKSIEFEFTYAYFEKTREQWRAVYKKNRKHIEYFDTKAGAVEVARKHDEYARNLLS